MAKKDVYPLTTKLEELVSEQMKNCRTNDDTVDSVVQEVLDKVTSSFGEYEHGSVDIEDLLGDNAEKCDDPLQMLADIYSDMVLTICNS